MCKYFLKFICQELVLNIAVCDILIHANFPEKFTWCLKHD